MAVRFYDRDGEAVGTGVDTVAGPSGGARTEFGVDRDTTIEDAARDATDDAVTGGDYPADARTVR